MTANTRAQRFYWLDLFRLAAAMTVVIVHARGAALGPYGALPDTSKSLLAASFYLFTRIGNEAVVAFFVLSGFFVGGMATERILRRDFDVANYTIDRFTRIMLPLVPALLLTAFALHVQAKPLELGQFAANLFSLQGVVADSYGGNAPLWSLAYEVWFYILTGVVGALAMRNRWSAPLTITLLVVALVFTKLAPIYLLCWLIGAAAYLRRPEKTSAALLWVAILLMGYGVACVQVNADSVSISADHQQELRRWFLGDHAGRLLLATGFSALIQYMVLRVPKKPWSRRLEAAGSKGAAFSYSLFLTHYIVIQLAIHFGFAQSNRLDARAFAGFGFLILLSVATGWVNYWLFERHTEKVRTWLKVRWAARRARAGTYVSQAPP